MSKESFDWASSASAGDDRALSTSGVPLPGGLSLRRLEAHETDAFAGMVFPAHRHLLSLERQPRTLAKKSEHTVQPWAWGAYDAEQRPAAMALTLAPPDDKQLVEILSIFVVPEHRRRGVGTALLKALEPLAAAEGGLALRTVYSTGKSYQPIIEKMMRDCSWREPYIRMHFFKIRLEDLAHVTRRLDKPRKGFEIGFWRDVSEEERKALAAQPWAPKDITPKVHGQEYDPDTSMALRYHGELVGWALTERVSDDLGRVAATYVRPDLSRTGALIPMLAQAARAGWDVGYRKATFTAVLSHPKLTRFAYKRLAPHCYSIVESRGAERHFSDD